MLLSFLTFFHSLFSPVANPEESPWLILYSSYASESDLKPFNPIVFDAQIHPPLDELAKSKKTIYGRVDIEQLFYAFPQFAHIKDQPQAVFQMCQESFVINWMEHIVENEIPALLKKGFNGIFLDGISAWKKATAGAQKFRNALPQLILLMRLHFPGTPIIVQSDQSVVEEIGGSLEGVVKFSVITTYNEETNQYQFVDAKLQGEAVAELKKIKEGNPQLQVFTVDFWDPNDGETIQKIYEAEKANGFRPYVGNFGLNKVVSK